MLLKTHISTSRSLYTLIIHEPLFAVQKVNKNKLN